MYPILQVGSLPSELEQQLTKSYDLHRLADKSNPDSFLEKHGKKFIGLVTSAGGQGVPRLLMAALPELKIISIFGVGLEKIDMAQARKRNITVGYTPDVLSDCVADTAFALMLNVGRRVSESDRFIRQGSWSAGSAFGMGRKVSGARLGIVGLGRIGQTIARRASGFDMDVRYHSRRLVSGVPWLYEQSLLDLAAWANFLVVITVGGVGTRHLINADVLNALGHEGFLINVARGSVVDESALIEALKERRIAGAGLDVFEHEPLVPQELLALDNVVVSPHIASATYETHLAMMHRVLENFSIFFSEGRVISSAN